MLNQFTHWIEIVGTAVDALLLLRVLLLKLQRTYFFITLACVLTLFFDGASLWLGPQSRESIRVFFYSRFLYAFIFPAAAYDVWEEIRTQVGRIRKLAMIRMVSSLVLASILGLVIAEFAGDDQGGDQTLIATFALILWTASCTASLAFLWSVHRATKSQKIQLAGNTSVWLLFYQLSLAEEVVACFLIIAGQQLNTFVASAVDISLGLYGIFIALWCVWRLRALPSDAPPAPERASS